MITRRHFLRAAGTAAAAGALPSVVLRAAPALAQSPPQEEVVITDTITPADQFRYRYFPFEVPAGVNRLDATIAKGGLALGFGVFDERGPDYQSPGFRGVLGGEAGAFFLTAAEAALSFIPGAIRPGTWTLIVPVFSAPIPAEITMRVVLSLDPRVRSSRRDRRSGWCRSGQAGTAGTCTVTRRTPATRAPAGARCPPGSGRNAAEMSGWTTRS